MDEPDQSSKSRHPDCDGGGGLSGRLNLSAQAGTPDQPIGDQAGSAPPERTSEIRSGGDRLERHQDRYNRAALLCRLRVDPPEFSAGGVSKPSPCPFFLVRFTAASSQSWLQASPGDA